MLCTGINLSFAILLTAHALTLVKNWHFLSLESHYHQIDLMVPANLIPYSTDIFS